MPATQPQPERDEPRLNPAVAAGTHTRADVVILGGGVAGLWSGAVLAKKGYSVLLIEREALGTGQTIASQGILHGGIKYTLGGQATGAARAVAAMPSRWHMAMTNARGATLDLRGVETLCPAQYLWTTGSLFSRITAQVAAKAIRTRVRAIDASEACEGLHGASGERATGNKVAVHQVDEPVIDPRSLINALHTAFLASGGISIRANARITCNRADQLVHIGEQTVRFSTLVATAGQGNQALITPLGANPAAMQRRPLHMVMARPLPGASLPALFGHCVAALSDKPRITVTTQTSPSSADRGRNVWYIGGEIAESGVERTREAQIEHARTEVAACLPWVDLRDTEWASFRVDRAEGRTADGHRPDTPMVLRLDSYGHVIAAWPTKLVFAPLVGDQVADAVARHTAPTGRDRQALASLRSQFPIPSIAPLPWEREDLQWS